MAVGHIDSDRERFRNAQVELYSLLPRPRDFSWVIICALVGFAPIAQASISFSAFRSDHATTVRDDLDAHQAAFRRHLEYAVDACSLYSDAYPAAVICEARAQTLAAK
jgi:hypothetical protein